MINTSYEDFSDTVLFDVMVETHTRLGAELLYLCNQAKARSDEAALINYENDFKNLDLELKTVDPDNRAQQIEKIKKWHGELLKLRASNNCFSLLLRHL